MQKALHVDGESAAPIDRHSTIATTITARRRRARWTELSAAGA